MSPRSGSSATPRQAAGVGEIQPAPLAFGRSYEQAARHDGGDEGAPGCGVVQNGFDQLRLRRNLPVYGAGNNGWPLPHQISRQLRPALARKHRGQLHPRSWPETIAACCQPSNFGKGAIEVTRIEQGVEQAKAH